MPVVSQHVCILDKPIIPRKGSSKWNSSLTCSQRDNVGHEDSWQVVGNDAIIFCHWTMIRIIGYPLSDVCDTGGLSRELSDASQLIMPSGTLLSVNQFIVMMQA